MKKPGISIYNLDNWGDNDPIPESAAESTEPDMSPENPQQSHSPASRQKQTISQLAQSGDVATARQLCTVLCEQTPDDAEAWFLLGAIHGAQEDFAAAEACCLKAIVLAPQHPMLRYNLAIALLKQQKAVEGIEQLEQAIALQPAFPDAHRELGNAWVMNNDPLRAISCYKQAARLDPSSADTALNLGNALFDQKRFDEAGDCFKKAIALKPDWVDAYSAMATTLVRQFKFDRAIALLEEATQKLPYPSSLFPLLALAHQEQGDADIALGYYEKALAADPDSVNASVGVAGIRALQGDYTAARELLEPMLASHPDNANLKTTYATFAWYFGAADKAIEIAEGELQNDAVPTRTKAKYHFALAHIYEKRGELDTAFEHYANGNRCREANFNHASYETMFRAIMDKYSADAVAGFPRSDDTAGSPIFIVGMPRSGTSLAEQILASHPEVFGGGELRNINVMVDKLPESLKSALPYPLCVDKVSKDLLNQLAESYRHDIDKRAGETVAYSTDKMPINFIHLGFISLLFPNARLIHCVRDPLDTCLSCYFKLFSGELPYAYSFDDLGKFYRLYQRLMIHWKRVLPTPIYELRYEDMVVNQEEETRKLVEFCGLDWNNACLDFHKTKRTVATASHDQVRKPVYTSSIGRWRAYEKHLGPLFTALGLDNRS